MSVSDKGTKRPAAPIAVSAQEKRTVVEQARADNGAWFKLKDILKYANLSWANFSHSNLRGANLLLAELNGANFEGADLTGARLNECVRSMAGSLEGVDLKAARLEADPPRYGDDIRETIWEARHGRTDEA